MTMTDAHVHRIGETDYPHEREAIQFAIEALPPGEPYHVWTLFELLEPATGRLYEVDMLVLGYSALYLVEVKSGPGIYTGDTVDWYREEPGGRTRYMDPPLKLTNLKAKILESRLLQRMKDARLCPRIEPLVFLSHENVDLRFTSWGDQHVVTRKTFRDAIVRHRFPGAPSGWRGERITRPQVRAVLDALEAAGVRPRKGQLHAGTYELGELLAEGPGYQDRTAVHRDNPHIHGRARTYLVPEQTSIERRQQLHRAAERESHLLYDVREHPNVLRLVDYVRDAPLGPTVVFDAFEDAEPLDVFLRRHPSLPFDDRIAIVEQVARALAFCHEKRVLHSALSPHAVLVRKSTDTARIETRLFNFQLGSSERAEGTQHWSQLASEPWSIYQAPELRDDPTRATTLSDLFSLGALAYFVFTGRPPGDDIRDVETRLLRDGHLDARAADDTIDPKVAEAIELATNLTPEYRADDAGEWIQLLLDVLTAPEPEVAPPELDPLEARAGDRLGGDLVVARVLGHGATSRVLLVERESDERTLALKISIAHEHDERLVHEAEALQRLRHPRIVQLVERRTLAGRTCLLLSFAGERTLYRVLAEEGTVSLDYAARFGEDLLDALGYLEEEQIVHRDIKPANLGVGAPGKKALQLTLFDFSLVRAAPTDLHLGTTAYRDPFLRQRGSWDASADRWSAAVTLHEMLTGVRPAFEGASIDPNARLVIAAERFDSSVREPLVAFFERALARDLERRFGSARDMRLAWSRVFEQPAATAPATASPTPTAPPAELTDDAIRAIAPESPAALLPLSTRALSALDRAGVVRTIDLLALPDNRLSAIRGVGRRVAREILTFRDRWRALREPSELETVAFFPGFRGEDIRVDTAGLDEAAATALGDAGLGTLRLLAEAPKAQVEAIAERHGFAAAAVHALLDRENRAANERERPSTLEGWLEALLPKRKKRTRYVEALYGLADPFTGRLDVPVAEVAEHFGKTRANVYLAVGDLRELWSTHGAVGELRQMARHGVEEAGGALPLGRAADAVVARVPHDRTAPEALRRARAAALLRIVAEVERAEPDGLRFVRLHDAEPWLAQSEAHLETVRALGKAADDLASRPVLASPSEAGRVLADVVRGTPLEPLGTERLLDLAVEASRGAARSTRQEIYPRGMAPERALDLTASVLASGLGPVEIRRRVAARYPDASPLPDRPALDALASRHGLEWVDAERCYRRPGETSVTSLQTACSSLTSVALVRPGEPPDEREIIARDFDDKLRTSVERRGLRILGVGADRARDAALALEKVLGVPLQSFDALFLEAMEASMRDNGVDPNVVHEADREGPAGSAWPNLLRLAELAADSVAQKLLPPTDRPLLLVQPGLIARYRLERFLGALVSAAKRDESQAIFVLVPSTDTGGAPRINGDLPVPGILPNQSTWIPRSWISLHTKEAA